MKRIKGLLKTVLLLLPALIIMETMSFAEVTNGPYLMLYKKSNSRKSNSNTSNYYAIETSESTTFGVPAIKIVKSNDIAGSSQIESSYNEAIYCIKGGQGFGSGNTSTVVQYEHKFNMRNPSEITGTYYKWTTENYPKIMWLLDNICVPSDSDSKSALLSKANVSFSGSGFNETKVNDIIESVQQAALWYFTNPSGEFHTVEPADFVLNVGNPSSHTQVFEDDMSGMDPAKKLYKYLVDTAKTKGSYDYSSATEKPLTYVKGFTSATAPTSKLSSDGTKYIIGPYQISKSASKDYTTFNATITDGTNTITSATVTDANGTALTGSNNTERIVGSFGSDFYITVPIADAASSVKLSITAKYAEKTITYYWASNGQPVAIIETVDKNNDESYSITPPPPVFDLALRKFITKVTNSSGTEKTIANINRTPDADTSSLTSGTTATYKHRKDPVSVETGDIVTYKLRIYNEGSAIGRATKIIDQLPTGVTLQSSGTVRSTKGNTYTIQNDATNNRVVLSTTGTNNIAPYGTTLDYDEIEIKCTVSATADTTSKKVLTNVAWISEEINASTGETITNQSGKDRDSIPSANSHFPDVNKDNMANYTGNGNKSDLSDTTYYYKGQEDDDDFEKLVINPVNKELDLALRKWISAVATSSGDMTNATYRRIEVDESPLKNSTGTTAIYKHSKDAIEVETGSIVYYNLRIYNEGEVAGRATQITDQLPEGLEFVEITDGHFELDGSYDETNNIIKLKRKSGDANNANLPAYSEGSLQENGNGHETITIKCKVTATYESSNGKDLTNIAWISKQVNESGEEVTKDVDSEPGKNPNVDKNSNDYKGTTSETDLSKQIYYPGQEDDDDFEKIKIRHAVYDLALRKFITKIVDKNGTEKQIESREPELEIVPPTATWGLDNGTTSNKIHSKQALQVSTGDTVIYTIRVYNEGNVDGKATEITDYLPDGLEFIEPGTGNGQSKVNLDNGWTANGKVVKTTILADKTIHPVDYNPNNNETGLFHIPRYEDIQIECKVVATKVNGFNLRNIAAITGDDGDDIDSNPSENPKNDSSYPTSSTPQGKGEQDDDDYENLTMESKIFDLALRKYITKIEGKTVESREPQITAEELNKLAGGTATFDGGKTAEKDHSKTPIEVSTGDIVTYTIRVYNEGEINGYATKITDYLPSGLEFIKDNSTNKNNGWEYDEATRKLTTTKLKDSEIKAFDKSTKKLESVSIDVVCKVVATKIENHNLRNIAAITEYKNDENAPDVDSQPEEIDTSKYNAPDSERGKGEQDDDDYEDLKLVKFDLALRKFITGVNHNGKNEEITNRAPKVDTSKYGTVVNGKEVTTFTYTHTKEPVKVEQNDVVTYTIRVYNEGSTDGYASVIKDDIPEGLEFLPDNSINKEYGWKLLDKNGNETTDVSKAEFITTKYLEKKSNSSYNLLKAFTTGMQEPDHKDVKVAFKVIEPNTSDRIITNKAQISKHTDKNGNDINDIDSTPDKWNEGEDDQDVEHIYVKYFDLALRKWVTHAIVIEDGQQKEMETGHKAEDDPESIVKVELNKKRLDNTVVKFRYSIRITNEGEIAGYATEISDYIPKGLRFNQADNPKWKEENGKIVTDQLKDTLLQPGQSATIDVLLTWINDEKNMGVMVNVAEISEDKNDSNTPDIDSTPNNKKDGEDDIDDAPVALTVVTGSAPTYIAVASGVVLIIGASVFFIKKYVV